MYIVNNSIFIISLLIDSCGGQSSEEERERSEAEDKVDVELEQKHKAMSDLLKTPGSAERDAKMGQIDLEITMLYGEKNRLKAEKRKKRHESRPRNTVT